MKKVLVGGVTAALLGLSPLAAFAASMNPDDYCSDFNATLTVSDSTTPVTSDGQTYSNSNSDGSGVYVSNGATATLTNAMISTSGASNTNTAFPSDESTQYGINSGVLVNGTGSTLTITGGSITTSGYIANAAFATEGGTINISGTADNPFTITATGYHSHGVDVTYGGTINLSYVTISTSQDISSGVATDFGGGTINADHITVTTNGGASAGIYVIGDGNGKITVTNSTITSEKSEGADVAGGGTLNLTDTNVTGVNALKLFTTGTTAEAGTATISGGSLTSTGGDAIVFSNDTGTVTVEDGCTITASNGILVDSTSCSAGSVIANGETLTGGIITDSTSTLAMSLANSSFTGYTSGSVALTMDSSSQWNLNTDSTLTAFNDNSGTVTFTSPSTGGAYYTLATTGDLSGSGTFNMNVDLSTAKANLITIGGTASGSYTLYFTGQNSSSTLSDDVKVVDLADSATNTATFTGGGDLGAYRYAVALGSNLSSGLDGSDYYLYNTY
ncbi:MAG: hypothetical protein H6Q73_4201, partial [Firmicutes bacterium]|nr:hypothetical protein [Bacillota bacterium]